MAISVKSKINDSALPVILLAAVVQGWTLYALHLSLSGSYWPATRPAWLLAFYAVAVFIPLTAQLLAVHARRRPTWLFVGPMAVLFLYFGWHHGARVMDPDVGGSMMSDDWFPLAFVLGVLWLHMLPFIQCRLAGNRWRFGYQALFEAAWRNTLVLAEAALFTILFWLLLFLWQALFRMLGIGFFHELFKEPIFIYPITSLAFGCALHLIGSIDRLTHVILEQLLNVLKWLAILAGLILALFTVALVFKLPGMFESGQRAINASWLLWLVAVTILLVNAAYRDGSIQQPYPKWISMILRCVMPSLIVSALVALYALYIRIDSYGFTVERVWASIVTIAACIYAVGYAIAARSGSRWMAGIASVNVVTALFLIGAISLALTPILSPYRIAANSQFRLAQERPFEPEADARGYDTPLHSLRFDTGRYGMARLRELVSLQHHPRAAQIREAADAMLARENRWLPASPRNLTQRLSKVAVHPSGRSIDATLLGRLDADMKDPQLAWLHANFDGAFAGVFVDLNADMSDEFVLLAGPSALAYEQQHGDWRRIGQMASSPVIAGDEDIVAEIIEGNVVVRDPAWRDLMIGRRTFRLETTQPQ